jgi:hypothetical protein
MNPFRPAANSCALAFALMRDGFRRPWPWAAAGAAGAAAMAVALLLPSAGPVDRVRIAASFTSGLLFLLACGAAVLLPASLLRARRSDGLLAAWAAAPGGRPASFAACFLASAAWIFLWTAFLACVQAALVSGTCRGLQDGRNPLAPRREIRSPDASKASALSPGAAVSFRFPPSAPSLVPPEGFEGEAAVRLFLARPASEEYGIPLTLTMRGEQSLPAFVAASVSSVKSRSVAFRVPAAYALEGFTLDIRQGASCFDAEIPEGGPVLFGARASPWTNFATAAVAAFLAAVFLAAVSAAGAAFLSRPVAIALASAVGLAGVLAGPATGALAAWERTGLLKAKENVPDLPSWFGAYKSVFELLAGCLPDLGPFLRPGDLADATSLAAGSIALAAAVLAAYALPAFLAGWWLHARGDQGD